MKTILSILLVLVTLSSFSQTTIVYPVLVEEMPDFSKPIKDTVNPFNQHHSRKADTIAIIVKQNGTSVLIGYNVDSSYMTAEGKVILVRKVLDINKKPKK